MSIKQELQDFCKIHNILINAVEYEGVPALQIMKIEDNSIQKAIYIKHIDFNTTVDLDDKIPSDTYPFSIFIEIGTQKNLY